MTYAHITHIDQVREAIEGNEAFYIADKGDYLVVNYVSIITAFPPLTDGNHAKIMRELRGITFCAKTGEVLRRPLHKFFNYNQTAENHESILDAKKIVAVYDKLDGSMCAPFMLNGEIRWGSKMGLTHIAPDMEAFVERNPQYAAFAAKFLPLGWTPIFEYMAPKHRIVVDHREEKMVLLAMRMRDSGEYLPYSNDSWCGFHKGLVDAAAEFNIPVVRRWDIDADKSLIAQVHELEGAEGVVVEYDDGTRVKVKSLWYMDLHKNREAIAKEKYVVGLILNDRIDDALGLVPDHVKPKLESYTEAFLKAFTVKEFEVLTAVTEALNKHETKKDIALDSTLDHNVRWICFKLFDLKDSKADTILDLFKGIVLKMTTKSDTDFDKECRKGIFGDALPTWNIWDGTEAVDEG